MFSKWNDFTEKTALSENARSGEKTFRASAASNTGQFYIVKRRSMTGLPADQQKLIKKAEFMKTINHENIVLALHYFIDERSFFTVLEYCDGGTLLQAIEAQKQQGKLFARERLEGWLVQLVDALKYLHKKTLPHRNVKAENIYLTNAQTVAKLSNFKTLSAKFDDHSAPEVVLGKPYTEKADTWALGIVMLHSANLKHPFSKLEGSLKDLILSEPLPPIPEEFGEAFQEFLSSLLERDVEKRPTFRDLSRGNKFLRSIIRRKRIEKLEQKAQARRDVKEEKRKKQAALKEQISSLQSELNEARSKLGEAELRISDLNAKLEIAQNNERQALRMVADLETVLEASKADQMNKRRASMEVERNLHDASSELTEALQEIDRLKKELASLKLPNRPHQLAKSLTVVQEFKEDSPNSLANALVEAVKLGDKVRTKQLLSEGAPVDARDAEFLENTALMWAAKSGLVETCRLLVEGGADLEAKATDGATALICAICNGQYDAAKYLIDCGADYLQAANNDGNNCLIFAADGGFIEIVALLLDCGVNVDATNNKGSTALIQAAMHGFESIVKLLLDYGAQMDTADWEVGSTALLEASANGQTETVHLLLDYGADMKKTGTDGATALICASACGHLETVKLLLARGSDVNAQSDEGATALILASQNGFVDVVRLLCQHGANVNVEAANGATALACAREQNHVEIVQILMQ